MLMAQCQQLYEFQKRVRLTKHKKIQKSSRAFTARMAMLEAKTDNNRNESLFPDEKTKASNRNNPVLDRKVSGTKQSYAYL